MNEGEAPDRGSSSFKKRLEAWGALSASERSELALALLDRSPGERAQLGEELLRREYPGASREMIRSGAVHAYMKLPESLRDGMAWLEFCIRGEQHDQHPGINFEIIYHLYNWIQAEALFPWGQQDVFDALGGIKDCLNDDDPEGAMASLEQLMERYEANVTPPDIET